MRLSPVERSTADGRAYTSRSAQRRDTLAYLEFSRGIHEHDPHATLWEAGEYEVTSEQIADYITWAAGDEIACCLVAVHGGRVVGAANLRGRTFLRVRHVVELSVMVEPGWRRQGVARMLIDRIVAAATAHPVIRKIMLRVYSPNTAALSLYEALGFVVEGRLRDHVRLDGQFADELVMALHLKGKSVDSENPVDDNR